MHRNAVDTAQRELVDELNSKVIALRKSPCPDPSGKSSLHAEKLDLRNPRAIVRPVARPSREHETHFVICKISVALAESPKISSNARVRIPQLKHSRLQQSEVRSHRLVDSILELLEPVLR